MPPKQQRAATPIQDYPKRCETFKTTFTYRGCLEYQAANPHACQQCADADKAMIWRILGRFRSPFRTANSLEELRRIRKLFGMKMRRRKRSPEDASIRDDYVAWVDSDD